MSGDSFRAFGPGANYSEARSIGSTLKDETSGRSSALRLINFLCVFVPLWLQS
jgi:hypothetical protein